MYSNLFYLCNTGEKTTFYKTEISFLSIYAMLLQLYVNWRQKQRTAADTVTVCVSSGYW